MRKLKNEWKLVWKFVNKLWFKIKPLFGGLLFDLFIKIITWFEFSIWLLSSCGAYFFLLYPKKVNIFHQFFSTLFDNFCSGKFFNPKSRRGSQNLDSLLYRVIIGCPRMLTFPKYWHVPLTKNYHKAGLLTSPEILIANFHAGNTQFIK